MDQQQHYLPQQTQGSEVPPPYTNSQDNANAPALPARTEGAAAFPPPPQRSSLDASYDDPSSPTHFTRDPHKLVGYLVPFPQPVLHGVPPNSLPPRFLIYTPPPPPLKAPKEGEKEDKLHKVQRKWQNEVRSAKTSDAKTASWKGLKSKATRGINKAMGMTTSSSLDFLGRIGGGGDDATDKHAEDGHPEGEETHKTVSLEEMVLVYPSSLNMSPDQLRQEFVDTMMRSKTKAQRDAVIATGLLPVSACIDLCATLVWPFGGLLEIDSVWAYSSIRGAKTSRSVTKRLTSSSQSGNHDEDQLKLEFLSSPLLQILQKYLAACCHERDPKAFPSAGGAVPTESNVLEAIGWTPTQSGEQEKNWEDEQWETSEVKEDFKSVMGKGAKEWAKWVKLYEKDPAKASKK